MSKITTTTTTTMNHTVRPPTMRRIQQRQLHQTVKVVALLLILLVLSTFLPRADGQSQQDPTETETASAPSPVPMSSSSSSSPPPPSFDYSSYPSPLVVFNIDYSREGCETSAVGMKGFILEEVNSTFYGPPPPLSNDNNNNDDDDDSDSDSDSQNNNNLVCAEASRCPIGRTVTDECPTANTFVLTRDNTTKEITANPSWGVVGPDVCRDSAWIPSCYYNYQTLDDLKSNPNILANSNIDDLRLMQNYIYTIYYDDEECKDITSLFSSNSGAAVTLPSSINDPNLPCEVASSCAVDPNSKICQSVRDGRSSSSSSDGSSSSQGDDIATLILETRRDETNGEIIVFECDSSNEDAGQQECFPTVPTKCVKSTLYSNCYYRHVSGPRLAQDPAFFVNGEGVTATPSEPPSLPPSDEISSTADPPTNDPPSSSSSSSTTTTAAAAIKLLRLSSCHDRSLFQILVAAAGGVVAIVMATLS